jgi:hypothetical protein
MRKNSNINNSSLSRFTNVKRVVVKSMLVRRRKTVHGCRITIHQQSVAIQKTIVAETHEFVKHDLKADFHNFFRNDVTLFKVRKGE